MAIRRNFFGTDKRGSVWNKATQRNSTSTRRGATGYRFFTRELSAILVTLCCMFMMGTFPLSSYAVLNQRSEPGQGNMHGHVSVQTPRDNRTEADGGGNVQPQTSYGTNCYDATLGYGDEHFYYLCHHSNTSSWGDCTWWAWQEYFWKFKAYNYIDAQLPNMGGADQWWSYVQAHPDSVPHGNTPVVGAIAVFDKLYVGHVAIVTDYSGNMITVDESSAYWVASKPQFLSYEGINIDHDINWYPQSDVIGYIYPPSSYSPPPPPSGGTPDAAYVAEGPTGNAISATPNQPLTIYFTMKNTGTSTWSGAGSNPYGMEVSTQSGDPTPVTYSGPRNLNLRHFWCKG